MSFHRDVRHLWADEKAATLEAIVSAKEEALTALAHQREVIMRMGREEAINALIRRENIDGREFAVRRVSDNQILAMA